MKPAKSNITRTKILPSLKQGTFNSSQKSPAALPEPEQPEEEVGYLELIEELHQSEENLRLALVAGNMGIWDWQLTTGELRWSQQLERLFGLEPGSFPRTYEAFIGLVHPDDRARVQKEAAQVALGQPYDQDYRIILPDATGTGTGTGTVRYMHGKGRLYRNAQGQPERVLGLTTDITDRKKEETNRQFLVEAGEVLTSSLDYETVLKNLSRLVVPRLADWCTIDLADEQQEPPRLRALILTHCDPHKEKFIYELKQAFLPQQDETNPMVQVLVTGRSSFISRIPAELIEAVSQNDPALRQLLSELGLISAMYVPLIARGRSLGVLSLNTDKESGRELTADDLALVEELARRAALAADNARLYRDAQLARRQAEAASERLRRLQEVTAALSKAITSQEVIRVMLEQGRAAAKADIASVILATTSSPSPSPSPLSAASVAADVDLPETVYRLVAISSEEATLAQQWYPAQIPLDPNLPAVTVAKTGQPLWMEDLSKAPWTAYPSMQQARLELGRQAYALVPIRTGQSSLGTLALGFNEPRGFNADEQDLLLSLATQSAQALERARLYERELASRQAAERAEEYARRLQHLSAALSRALTPTQVAQTVSEHGVAALGAKTSFVLLTRNYNNDNDNDNDNDNNDRETNSPGGITAEMEMEMEVASVVGFAPAQVTRWQRYPVPTSTSQQEDGEGQQEDPLLLLLLGFLNTLAQEAVVKGQAIWLESFQDPEVARRYPKVLALTAPAHGTPHGDGAYLIAPLMTEDRPVGVLGLGFDTPRRFVQEERNIIETLARLSAQALERTRLYLDLQEALRDRDEFLSVAAHELKTPLTGLKGFTQLLVRQLDKNGKVEPERLGRSLQAINTQSDKLARLIDQLLNLTRIEAGRLKLEKQATDVNSLLASIVVTANTGIGASHHIELKLPNQIVTAQLDPLRIEQVVNNLLDNAVKYSPGGGIVTVELALIDGGSGKGGSGNGGEEADHQHDKHGEDDDGEEERSHTTIPPVEPKFIISVRDKGIGIPPERRAHIFERFYQAHSLSYISGMGLGLYISQQIIELHEGQIRAEFPVSGGTRFVITLPLS
jgi:signal transduction histidine kinase